jgi:hypothetical protein
LEPRRKSWFTFAEFAARFLSGIIRSKQVPMSYAESWVMGSIVALCWNPVIIPFVCTVGHEVASELGSCLYTE